MTRQVDVSRAPTFSRSRSTRKLQELSDDIRVSLEHGQGEDLSRAPRSVAKIDELVPSLGDSIRNRLADAEFFGRPPTL
jgi:hypothetical protein